MKIKNIKRNIKNKHMISITRNISRIHIGSIKMKCIQIENEVKTINTMRHQTIYK